MHSESSNSTSSSLACRGKVLIVEDQYFVAIDCELNLQSAGFDCVGLATNACDALEIASRCKPDLVLMDIRLAGHEDGVTAALNIFNELGIRSIFTSGHADRLTRDEARAAQPLGWLDKPYTHSELVDAVTKGMTQLTAIA